MATVTTLEDLFCQKLRYVYDAEQRLTKALPKMSQAARSAELKQAFDTHLTETRTHVERLERIFPLFNIRPNADTNAVIQGAVAAGESTISLNGDDAVRDAGLISAAQEAEHYEIAAYGTLRTWAEVLGRTDAVQLLEATLDEEKMTDETLTRLASRVNIQAASARG